MDQDGRTEEIFVAERHCLAVLGEIHHQRPHDQVVFQDGRSGEGIDVRHQLVTELDGVQLLVEGPFSRLAEAVNLRRQRPGSMVPHHGNEDAPLHPADLELLQGVIGSATLIEIVEESADVGVPVGDTADGIVKSRGNLRAEHFPAGLDVAAPAEGRVALDAESGAAGHLHGPFRVPLRPIVLVDAHVGDQRERVPDAAPTAVGRRVIVVLLCRPEMVRLRGVAPEGVDALVHQAFQVFPVDFPGPGVERVIDFHAARHRPGLEGEEGIDGLELLELRRLGTEVRPDGDDEVGVVPMDIADHRVGPGVERVVEPHRVPVLILAPVLPVLDDTVQRNSHLAVRAERLAEFLRTVIPLAALPVPVQPEREHFGLAAERVLRGDHLVQAAAVIEEIEVRTVGHLAAEDGAVGPRIVEIAHAGIVPIHAISLLRAEERNVDVHVLVPQVNLLSTDAEVRILPLAHAVHVLVRPELPALGDLISTLVHIPGWPGFERRTALLQKDFPGGGIAENDLPGGFVDGNGDLAGIQDDGLLRLRTFDPDRLRLHHHGITLLLRRADTAGGILDHPDDFGRVDGHFTSERPGVHSLSDDFGPVGAGDGEQDSEEDGDRPFHGYLPSRAFASGVRNGRMSS